MDAPLNPGGAAPHDFYDEYDAPSMRPHPARLPPRAASGPGGLSADYYRLAAPADSGASVEDYGAVVQPKLRVRDNDPRRLPPSHPANRTISGHARREASLVVFGGIMAYSFVVCLENVIVFPSLWPRLLEYCGPTYSEATLQTYLGWTMGAFSLGRGFSALVINGQAPTRCNMRVAATLCFLFSACGCGLYVFADTPQLLVLSRTLSGLGAGALTLMITSLTSLSSPETRTSAISQFFVAAALGEIVGPLLAYGTANLTFELPVPGGDHVHIDSLNSVGLWTLGLFVLSFVFVCRSIDASATDEDDDNLRQPPLGVHLFTPTLVMIFTLALFVNMGVSAWETVVTPLAQQHFAWGVEYNSLLFVLSGAILFFSNIVLVRLATACKLSDEMGSLVSIVVATCGASLLIVGGDDLAIFVSGNLLFTLGIFCPLTFVTSMYTKNIVARPALFIGAFRASSAGIRVVGNLLAAYSLSFSGNAARHGAATFCGGLIPPGGNGTGTPAPAPAEDPGGGGGGGLHAWAAALAHGDKLSATGPEFLLLTICVASFMCAVAIWCMRHREKTLGRR